MEENSELKRSTAQIIRDLRPPTQLVSSPSSRRIADPPLEAQSLTKQRWGQKQSSGEPGRRPNVNGPAQCGPSIEDLFSHSYTPPQPPAPTLTSRWW